MMSQPACPGETQAAAAAAAHGAAAAAAALFQPGFFEA
jgi:hypothetical protein